MRAMPRIQRPAHTVAVRPSRQWFPARTLHLVDIENLAGAALPSRDQVTEVQGLYVARLGFGADDQVVMAASHLAFAASANNDPTTTLQALDIRGKVLPQSPSSLFLAATAHDKLHHTKQATDLYKQFLSVANGQFPDEEWEARHRLLTLDHMK